MREKGVSKTALWKAEVIKESTWRRFDQKLDDGTMSVAELFGIIDFLEIEPVRAAITFKSLKDVADYFEPSCETASYVAIEMAISLAEKISALEGNFNPMKQSAWKTYADQQAATLIQQSERINNALLGRDLHGSG